MESKTPGPGAYNPAGKEKSVSFTVSRSRRKFLVEIPPGPGPQQYTPKPLVNGEYQSIGIGVDQRRTFMILSQSPGPGAYIRNELKKNAGFTYMLCYLESADKKEVHRVRGMVKDQDQGLIRFPPPCSIGRQHQGIDIRMISLFSLHRELKG